MATIANHHLQPTTYHLPLVVICGPTASGKSGLAMKIALACQGEIICADSRTVYKGMDIGTAKPSKADQHRVKHHLLDVAKPNQKFTAFNFQQLARRAIVDIRQRNNCPILVGGTGLYIDSIVFDYQFPPTNGPSKKTNQLQEMTLEELHSYCLKNNIKLPLNFKNKRHVVNAILRNGTEPNGKKRPIENCFVVGMSTKKEDIVKNIAQRTEHIFENGVVAEAKKLGEMYGTKNEAMTGNVYRLAQEILDGSLTIHEAKQKNNSLDWQLARRQLSWLRRNQYIHWDSKDALYDDICQYIETRKNTSQLLL